MMMMMMMHSSRAHTHTVLCIQIMCFLVCWPLLSDAAKLRCGTDLLSDLLFVCGDRGIHLRQGSWSSYGARPRGKGIVDQCCRGGGCELHHLEKYCAKAKGLPTTTASPLTTTTASPPTTTTASPPTTTTTPPTTASLTTPTASLTTPTASLTTPTVSLTTPTASLTTPTSARTTTQPEMVQQFEAVFHKRLLQHLGAPDSPKREAYRKRRRGKVSSSNRRRKESAASSGRATR